MTQVDRIFKEKTITQINCIGIINAYNFAIFSES